MKQLPQQLLWAALVLVNCQFCALQKNPTNAIPGLKDAYRSDFLIGTALTNKYIEKTNRPGNDLIRKQFNTITPENCMKAALIHPEWGRYDFTLADKLVAYCKKNKLLLNGHTLVWHSQLPRFAHQIQNQDSFKLFFESHITAVATRYSGKVFSWDVVNEALNEDGSLRNSVFLDKLGPGYIVAAFRLAEKASPNTELYYNDYNIEQPLKRNGCLELVKKIQEAGVRIDGVGIQGHWQLGKIPFAAIEESIIAYHSLGLKVLITELDIDVLPGNYQGADLALQQAAADSSLNPYAKEIPDSILVKQAKDYEKLFQLLLKHKDKIARVTFWGVEDGSSWLNGWPMRGRTNFPLLFDRQLLPKPAYHAVMGLKHRPTHEPFN